MTADENPPGSARTVGHDALGGLHNRRVFIETYGCRYNFGDSAKLAEILSHNGNVIVESEKDADVIFVNTCTVVGPTERRMLRRLSYFRDRELYVTGCLPAVQLDAIMAVCAPTIVLPDAIQEMYSRINTVSSNGDGIVQIARGCPGACSYCITRFARGDLRSFSQEDIARQVTAFAGLGIPEIQLTAQDVSSWGMDTSQSFPSLLCALNDIPGRFMLRVGMMNPATAKVDLPGLVKAFSGDHVFKFLHLPVQSGSDRILQGMNRQYSVMDFEEIVSEFRKVFPDITVMTDIIVGFCGETDDDFDQSMDLIRRVRPNKVNVTRYSARPITPRFGEKEFPEYVKKDRSRAMNSLAEEIYAAINRPLIGRRVGILVTERIRPGSVMARTSNYTGVVINQDLPQGYTGEAVLKTDRKYFFIGELVR